MRTLLILTTLMLIACKSSPPPLEQLVPPLQAFEAERVAEIKNDTLWMYSTGSFALACIGLAFIAFLRNKFAGVIFIVGGLVGMATVWVFESTWFPWVAGATVGFLVLNALAFAWVKVYKTYISSSSKTEEDKTKCTEDDSRPQT
jgi:hypothetical protein